MKKSLFICTLITLLCFAYNFIHSAKPITQINIVFDASKSMLEKIQNERKIEIAKRTLTGLIDMLSKSSNFKTSLRVYGHLNKECAGNSSLEIPMGFTKVSYLKKCIENVKARGKTPLAFSLRQAEKDFEKNSSGKKVIILVTDGVESCEGNPCIETKRLKKRGIVDKIHVIALGMKPSHLQALRCISNPYSGMLINATDKSGLEDAFTKVIARITKNNLVVISQNSKSRKIYANIDIYKNNEKIMSNAGSKVNFALRPGVYDIKASDPDTGLVLFKKGIEINPLEISIHKIIFRRAKLKITAEDKKGKILQSSVDLYLSGSKYKISNRTGLGIHELNVVPGMYDIKITDYDTKITKWIKNVKVKRGEYKEKQVKFNRGYLFIKAKNSWNQPAAVRLKVFLGKTNFLSAGGRIINKQKFILMPGKYKIKVIQKRSLAVMVINNVKIKNGETLKLFVQQLPSGYWYIHDENGRWIAKQ